VYRDPKTQPSRKWCVLVHCLAGRQDVLMSAHLISSSCSCMCSSSRNV